MSGILTIEWAGLRVGALAAANPLETELTPSAAWAPAWPTGTTVSLFEDVATSPRNTAAFMAVTWQPRRGITDLPFLDGDLLVDALAPEGPGGEEPNPGGGGDPGGGGGETPAGGGGGGTTGTTTGGAGTGVVAAPQPSLVRGPLGVRVGVSWQRARTAFAEDGLSVRLDVTEPATAEVTLVHTSTVKRGGKSTKRTRKLSRTVTQDLQPGRTKLALPASLTGRTYLDGRERSLRATLVIVLRSPGRPARRLTRTVVLTPPR